MIQRCQVHKKRNVKADGPEKRHAELERRLSDAYQQAGYEAAKASLEATARWLDRINPDAAASLWNRARHRVRMSEGTISPHDNGWDRGGSR